MTGLLTFFFLILCTSPRLSLGYLVASEFLDLLTDCKPCLFTLLNDCQVIMIGKYFVEGAM